MKNALKAIQIGYRCVAGFAAGYFVFKATEKVRDDLCDDGGVVNATVIAYGQGTLAAAAGILTYYIAG